MKFTKKIEVTYEAKFLHVVVPVDDDDMPADAPRRKGDMWEALINLDAGTIGNGNELARREDYVPNDLLPGDYGDYLELNIDATGKITNWLKSPSLEEFIKNED